METMKEAAVSEQETAPAAETETATEKKGRKTKAQAATEDQHAGLVPIRLFKDGGKYKDDVFVAVNGRGFQIKRGETVWVPPCVAEVLEQSMAQDDATADLIERESDAFAAEVKARGLGL